MLPFIYMNNSLTVFKEFLLSLNFSEKEAGVYICLLSLGKGTVTQIARNAGTNRTTGYTILDSLVNKGVVTISGKEPKQEYIAESPDTILQLLRRKKRETDTQLERAQIMIPQLKSIQHVGDRPQVRFYEGKEGLEQVYEDTLTSTEEIRAYATVDDMHATLPHYFPKYYKRRASKDIAIRAIVPSTQIGKARATQDKKEKRRTALIPPEKYYFSPEINIYDNKVMIASWREKLGIIIESTEIADAMKKIFELAWAEAKRFK